MPKVTFLQDLCSGVAGSVHDLQQYEADVLISMGVAELVQDETKQSAVPNQVTQTELSTDGLLLNANGTPVVTNFGDLVPLQVVEIETKAEEKTKAAKKK